MSENLYNEISINLKDDQFFTLPFRPEDEGLKGEYLYLAGGYNSIDRGSPDWGTSKSEEGLYIGDLAGTIDILYRDGSRQNVPLIFGHSMWFKENFDDGGAPFKTEEKDERLAEILSRCLYLQGAYEGDEFPVLKVALENKPIAEINLVNNEKKRGVPVFHGGFLVNEANTDKKTLRSGNISVQTDLDFFKTHTRDTNTDPSADLAALQHALYQFWPDFEEHPAYHYPAGHEGSKLEFYGNSLANIASAVIYHNLENLKERTDEDGFIHTSYKEAPSWRYNGFGSWVPKAGTFYTDFYSRDGARAIMTLLSYGEVEKAEKALCFAHEWIMYYPRQGLKINGKDIPGHYSVMPNKPLIYSEFLTGIGWPTQYTKERFGEGCGNLGNQETDGHGLMMMAAYGVFKNISQPLAWAEQNWAYLKEAADWILWCFENPEESFAKDDLLYGESEGGMIDYTLYNNVPCYLGLRMYAEIAESLGKYDLAAAWRKCADKMEKAIGRLLTENGRWREKSCGFFHDPVLTMFADFVGYDLSGLLPDEWLNYSKKTYPENLAQPELNGTYFGSTGIGYNHSMITQNALLLDRTEDSNQFVNNLSRICYAPRLAQPYLVPECISYDPERQMIRRQGDLGNLVQLAEVLKCYHLVAGICPVTDGCLKILPRLPEGWGMKLSRFYLPNLGGTIELETRYPENNQQKLRFELNAEGVKQISLRFGPFDNSLSCAKVIVNGKTEMVELYVRGDKKWCYVNLDGTQRHNEITVWAKDKP